MLGEFNKGSQQLIAHPDMISNTAPDPLILRIKDGPTVWAQRLAEYQLQTGGTAKDVTTCLDWAQGRKVYVVR